MAQHKHIGSSLDDLLETDGTLEQAEAEALKRVIVWQVQQAMKHTGVNKTQLAKRMHTSRTVVNRLLDEKDTGVTITTLVKAGRALGMTWTLESEGNNGSPQAA
ncbi:helix-turn-helix domain-containing protein [Marinobacter pelagius]|uniref:Helix-turn-helix domain-containing protein n=1 Tax=Marinobacter pelagius TaxID=379482 RepID=A0A1I4V691_9GAMM|nr:helix-turn-helix transcriptional regulator [Marinobacter pelagius]SFM96688.1 Helix-turn-helix domain-containing protein [Marinobacter pelagius]